MRVKIAVISAVIALSLLLVGCDFSIITDTGYSDKGKESVTFSGESFETDEPDSEIEIEKPESQKGEGDRVTSAGELAP